MNYKRLTIRIFQLAAILAPSAGIAAQSTVATNTDSDSKQPPTALIVNAAPAAAPSDPDPRDKAAKKVHSAQAVAQKKNNLNKPGNSAASPTAKQKADKPQQGVSKQRPPIPPQPVISDDSPETKKLQKELARLTLEKNLIDARLALEEAKRRAIYVARNIERQTAQNEEKSRIESELALANVRENAALAKKISLARAIETEAKIIKMQTENELAKHAAAFTIFQRKQEIEKIAPNAKPLLLKEPLSDGVLYISNRRVTFNGPVTARSAQHVIEQLNFFNNKSSEYPIFLVIDSSPGGSVAAGFQILKAMESSKAPVYVVVKGFAASMAAVITTLAERSYCYDNTIILHHQMSTGLFGNMGSLEDQIKFARQWYARLATPVAKKMGVDLKTFTKEMYKHNADADWQEFGTQAKKLKWVDNIVNKIVETGIVDTRTHEVSTGDPHRRVHEYNNGCEAKIDAKGVPFIQLPVLENPFDAWWIYDKRGYYRAQ
ncbi:MAG: ATP-dependent Clp protease proteolytic subunit [Puniceicoccales bacterium]|jgi:ATP-dependent Clp protease protease subunit|nr:ATP-dependent Clp protease proteolytic subunit [Puniceicoccales bacterium]